MNDTIMTYKKLLRQAKEDFDRNGIEDSGRNATELLGVALGEKPFSIGFENRLTNPVDLKLKEKFLDLCKRRIAGEPLQYLVGEWEFYGITVKVGKGVLIPRQNTETVVDTAICLAENKFRKKIKIADLCSGSGCIALALEQNLKTQKVFCVEKSDEAKKFLAENLELNNSSAEIIQADVTEKIPEEIPALDMIVCNPPYLTREDMENLQKEVSFEPEEALFGGEDGLDFYRDIVRIWTDALKEGGIILFEVGINQEDEVMKILIQRGYENVRCRKDFSGVNRCVYGTKPVSTDEIAIKVDYPPAR